MQLMQKQLSLFPCNQTVPFRGGGRFESQLDFDPERQWSVVHLFPLLKSNVCFLSSDSPVISVLVLHDWTGFLRFSTLQCGFRCQAQSEWVYVWTRCPVCQFEIQDLDEDRGKRHTRIMQYNRFLFYGCMREEHEICSHYHISLTI